MTTITNNMVDDVRKKSSFGSFMVKYGLAFFALLCMIIFAIIEPKFYSLGNIFNIIIAASVMGVTAMGLSLIMSTGEIDFAVGMEVTLAAIVLGIILDAKIVPNYLLAVILALVAMVIFGLVNSFFHIVVGIPAFIATMGTAFVAQGFAWWATGGLWINSQRWPDTFTLIGQGFLFNKIPIIVIFLVILSIIVWIYTELTVHGKTIYAVGSNNDACNYIGIDSRIVKLRGFVFCAVLCGIAGIMLSSQMNRVGPQMGETSLVTSLTAILLGATFLRPGVINIPGTLLGALIISILNNGFTMISAPTYSRDMILAIVMIVSVSVVTVIRRRTEKIE